jgi:hypothetical protein
MDVNLTIKWTFMDDQAQTCLLVAQLTTAEKVSLCSGMDF